MHGIMNATEKIAGIIFRRLFITYLLLEATVISFIVVEQIM